MQMELSGLHTMQPVCAAIDFQFSGRECKWNERSRPRSQDSTDVGSSSRGSSNNLQFSKTNSDLIDDEQVEQVFASRAKRSQRAIGAKMAQEEDSRGNEALAQIAALQLLAPVIRSIMASDTSVSSSDLLSPVKVSLPPDADSHAQSFFDPNLPVKKQFYLSEAVQPRSNNRDPTLPMKKRVADILTEETPNMISQLRAMLI